MLGSANSRPVSILYCLQFLVFVGEREREKKRLMAAAA